MLKALIEAKKLHLDLNTPRGTEEPHEKQTYVFTLLPAIFRVSESLDLGAPQVI